MPSPESSVTEDFVSGSDAEQIFPEQPKKWRALPPTRSNSHFVLDDGRRDEYPIVDTDSVAETPSFLDLVTGMFQQIKDVSTHLHVIQDLQGPLLRQHYLEVVEMTPESKVAPGCLKNRSSYGSEAARTSISSQGSKGSKASVTYAYPHDRKEDSSHRVTSSLVGCSSQTEGDDGDEHFRDSSRWTLCSRASASRGGSDLGERSSQIPGGNGFLLRVEWNIDEDDFLRIAEKPTLEAPQYHIPSKEIPMYSEILAPAYRLGERTVPLNPESKTRLCWDMLAGLLLSYDTVMLPLYLFEFSGTTATKVVDWITAVFWTIDVVASLCTGTFVKGRLEMRFARVMRKYIKTWMLPDLLMVCVEWTLIFLGTVDSAFASSVGAVRNMRLLRFVRLVRLAKIDRLIKQLTKRINSVYLLLSLRIIKMVLAIVFVNHILASAWYSIGYDGWVQDHIPDKKDVLYCYLTSFHWSLTQFHGSIEINPTGLKERLFAVIVLLNALVSVTWFMSSMTNSMIMLQHIHEERTSQQKALLGFIYQRQVPNVLAVRIKEYTTMHQKEAQSIISESDVKLLSILPTSMLMDLHEELRGQLIRQHPLFDHLSAFFTHFIRQLVHESVQELYFSERDVVFSTGQACKFMLFLYSEMTYLPGNMRVTQSRGPILERTSISNLRRTRSVALGDGSERVHRNTWVSEPVLWTSWQNCGTLRALEETYVYALLAEGFVKTVLAYESARLDSIVYAKAFMALLNIVTPSDLPNRLDAHKIWASIQEDRYGTSDSLDEAEAQPTNNRLSIISMVSTFFPSHLKRSTSRLSSIFGKKDSVRTTEASVQHQRSTGNMSMQHLRSTATTATVQHNRSTATTATMHNRSTMSSLSPWK